jgi:hypothetical protein
MFMAANWSRHTKSAATRAYIGGSHYRIDKVAAYSGTYWMLSVGQGDPKGGVFGWADVGNYPTISAARRAAEARHA